MERIFLGLAAIVVFFSAQAREPLPKEAAIQVIDQFQYQGNYQILSDKKQGGFFDSCWEYDRVFETQYPDMDEPLDVDVTLYVPNRDRLGSDQVPVVIMIPPVGGTNILDTQMARTFCDYDIAAIVLKNDFANIDYQAEVELLPPEDHQKTFYRIVAAVKGSMAMIDDDDNLKYDKIGIFGVSLGGILSSFVMETQSDISAGYFLVAGGDIPQILAYSEQENVSIIRRKRMNEENISTKEEYENYLRRYITLDPIDLAVTMLPETINMVIAKKDTTVPSSNQFALHKAFGEPEAIYYNSGHLDTIIGTLLWGQNRADVARFFSARFSEDNPRPPAFRQLLEWSLSQYM